VVEAIARRGVERLLRHHTSRARAQYFLRCAMSAVERERVAA
jgi:3-methyladenine DNA glycosylase/8-oxoguanine DNA glycosylase